MTAFTTPSTWTAGQTVTAASLNVQVRDNMLHLTEVQNWTPTITQVATVTKTVVYGRYWVANKRVWAICQVDITGSGTSGTAITFTLPVTATSAPPNGMAIGTFTCWDNGITEYVGVAKLTTTTTVQFRVSGNATNLGSAPAFGLASGDNMSCCICYEAA